ncbi:MAG: flagellar basal body P-ring protein FlgI [Phycisphaeraceae bacterium]
MHHATRSSLLALFLLMFVGQASATQVRNVVDLKGSEQSVISGVGVVVGLDGTGDGQFGPAHKAVLAAVMRNLDPTATPADFTDADAIALVHVRAVVPAEGVRSGVDRLDVTVATVNDASSLKGGVLLDAVLFGPGENGKAFAVASGEIMLPNEEENPRRARIARGAHMVRDIPSVNLDRNNRLTLVLHESKASWELANFIAEAINGVMVLAEDAEPIAFAVDQKNVIVQVPDAALPNLSEFITQIMVTTIDSEIATGGAKVIINRAEGTIVITGDVEMSPTVVMHKGMTIQVVTPEPEPDPNQPRIERNQAVAIDPDQRGGARLRQLLDAMNTLSIPIEDRISIINEIHNAGALHAELIYK